MNKRSTKPEAGRARGQSELNCYLSSDEHNTPEGILLYLSSRGRLPDAVSLMDTINAIVCNPSDDNLARAGHIAKRALLNIHTVPCVCEHCGKVINGVPVVKTNGTSCGKTMRPLSQMETYCQSCVDLDG